MIRAALALCFAALVAACAQTGTDAGEASAGVTALTVDARLMRDIAQVNLAQIAMGELAVQKAHSPLVRHYGQKMVSDHQQLLDAGSRLAGARKLPMPRSPDLEQQAALKRLEDLSDERFDHAYMQEMMQDHELALQMLERAAAEATDSALRAHVQKAQPVVQSHLDTAKRITGELVRSAS